VLQDSVALSWLPSVIFRRMHASPGGPDTESAPAGTPRTSARNLTLGRSTRVRGLVRDSMRMTL